jgi:hypothetical protein
MRSNLRFAGDTPTIGGRSLSAFRRLVFGQLVYKPLRKFFAWDVLKMLNPGVALGEPIQLVTIIKDFDLQALPPDADRTPICSPLGCTELLYFRARVRLKRPLFQDRQSRWASR